MIKKLLILLLVCSFSSPVVAGGMSDGGGCLLHKPPAKPLLIDLIYTGSSVFREEAGDQIEPASKIYEIKIDKLKSYLLALSFLEGLNEHSKIWGQYLHSALKSLRHLTFHATPFYFRNLQQQFCLPLPLSIAEQTPEIRPVVIFDRKVGLILSVPDFNSLDLKSQAGLWIHEAIRLIQILVDQEVDGVTVYEITASILSGKSSELDGRFSMPKALRERLTRDQIDFNESQNFCKSLAQKKVFNKLHAKYCRVPKTFSRDELGAIDKELENEIEHYYEQSWDYSTLRQAQRAIRDLYMVFVYNAVKNLDELPEIGSLSFAMKRINGKMSGTILDDELERVWQRLRMYGGILTTH